MNVSKDSSENPRIDRPEREVIVIFDDGEIKIEKEIFQAPEPPKGGFLKRRRREPARAIDLNLLEPPRDWNQWVSASATRNYLIKDPLLDWLEYHHGSLAAKKPNYAATVSKAVSFRRRDGNFTEFIMAQGNDFEKYTIEYLYRYHGREVICDIGGNGDGSRSEEKLQQTILAMNRGVPFIYSGVLHNPENCTYGVPDLIVRSDWLGELVENSPIDDDDSFTPAPLLRDFMDPSKPPKYHYRVVDIKFTSLALRADGIHLLNSGSIPAYKGQLWVYTKALGRIQGYEPTCAYILGRKWKYTTRNVQHRGTSCTERLGTIDYSGVDEIYVDLTQKAIRWILEMRRDGASWSLGPNLPLARPELYPNMSNTYDYPWHSIKKQIAGEISEISALWMCGVKNRVKAHAQGVYKWTDPRCTTEVLGVNGPKTKRVLDEIISINRDAPEGVLIKPNIIQNNDENWQISQKLEMFVDFEFVNDVVSDFTTMPVASSRSIIFMIGVGYFDPLSDAAEPAWIYRSFTVDALTVKEEGRICTEFSEYVQSEAEWWECPNPLLVHWSNAENWQWASASERHDDISRTWIPSKKNLLFRDGIFPRWFDLLQIFRKEPIVIKGCLGFGLKEVAGALKAHNLIASSWDTTSGCSDGAGAMLGAFKASKDALARGISLQDIPLIRDIVKYNEIDCKVVGEIMNYLRENHTTVVEDEVDEDKILIIDLSDD